MKVPVVAVGGIDAASIATTLMSLAWDEQHAVVLRYVVDTDAGVLLRLVSDLTGEVERVEVDLDHGCVTCALLADATAGLERLVGNGRWSTVLLGLPPGALADQLREAIEEVPAFGRRGRWAATVASLPGQSLLDDLLGDDLFRERGSESGPEDARGIGETACAMVETADAVALLSSDSSPTTDRARALVSALAPGNAHVVDGAEHLDLAWLREPSRVLASNQPELRALPRGAGVWQRLLDSPAPFEPNRLLERIEELGGGRHRSRGTFWLPGRPELAVAWDGAGGQLSIGPGGTWNGPPRTRLLLTGVGVEPAGLLASFEALLCTPAEASAPGAGGDGFEPWLGPVRDVA